jgi:hypothetical protein
MKTQRLFCASALAIAALAAGAQEATQFPIEPSTLTRAEVKAELARARGAGEIVNGDQADWQTIRMLAGKDRAVTVARSRAEVRQEALLAAHASTFDSRYVGG